MRQAILTYTLLSNTIKLTTQPRLTEEIMSRIVLGIYICPAKGKKMQRVQQVEAIAGKGLKGDRYFLGKGSWNKGRQGERQVTLMNAQFFLGTPFTYANARRNIFVDGIELPRLIGEDFWIGEVKLHGVKYCYVCDRPGKISRKPEFAKTFWERGGIIATITQGGIICTGNEIILPQKLQTT